MNVTPFNTREYGDFIALRLQKNKANSKPVLSVVEWAKFKIPPLKSAFISFEYSLLDKLRRIVNN